MSQGPCDVGGCGCYPPPATDAELAEALAEPVVQVWPSKTARGWPRHEHNWGGVGEYLALIEVMTKKFETDAHFSPYLAPDRAGRLTKRAHEEDVDRRGAHERLVRGVVVVASVFDFDCPAVHGTDKPAPESWRDETADNIRALAARHPGPYAHWTRGGGRCIYLIDPTWIRSKGDDKAWTARYERWCVYLAREFGLMADPACADWTRLYRAPHVVRDGVAQTWGQIVGGTP